MEVQTVRKKNNTKQYPVGRIGFLWENMQGKRVMFLFALMGTIVYNALQLVVPYFSGEITDTFLSGPDAANNINTMRTEFWVMILLMVGMTILRGVIVYMDCMAYEHVSQHALYRIRNTLYDRIQRQDMTFYAKYRTGDLMTRLTGDLNSVRHMVAWVVRALLECIALFGAATVYFFIMNWRLALCVIALCPVIFYIVYKFRLSVKPMHELLREKFAGMNTDAQENISGNRVVKAFAREKYEIEKFDKTNQDYAETSQKTDLTWQKFYPYVESCANLLPLILMVVGGLFMITDETDPAHLTMGEYIAFSGLIWAVCNPMRMLGNILNEFQRFSAAADKVMEIWYA